MKNFACACMLWILMCFGPKAFAQHPTELTPGYYLVVGAYAPGRENVAQNYTEVLNRRGFNSGYGFNTDKNLFFVYLKYFTDLRSSLKDMATTRRQNEFADAWVRVVPGDVNAVNIRNVTPVASETPMKTNDPQKKTGEKQLSEKQSQEKAESPKPVTVSEQKSSPVISEPRQTTQPVSPPVASNTDVPVTDNEEIKQYEHMTLGNTEVFLSLYNQRNNRIVDGMVKVVDTDRSKLLKEVKGNEYLILPDPKSTSGQLSLICEAFGYRKVQQEINYPVPLADTVKDFVDLMGTTIVVNFDLIRYRVGDVTTLYHVYFYNDAALMLPESKYELNSLLQMMTENPNYRIRLHGHTNGNYHGRIITMGDNKNYFSLDGSKNSVGSAKDLSYNRAEIIRDYLGDNGVDPSRVEVKAWGGKKPLYDKHSVNAKKNVRVEVEIISE